MIDKERLEEIKKELELDWSDISYVVNQDDVKWLIKQAEKVEQLQQENEKEQKRLKNQIYKTAEEKFLLEKQLQQAQAKAEHYKQALEFYANSKNWIPQNDDVLSEITMDYGSKARQALEGEG